MKKVLLGLIALLLIGCMENEMDEVKQLWSQMLASKNAEVEAEALSAIKGIISDKGMTIMVMVKNNEGQMVNINTLQDNEPFSSVNITFETGKGEFQANGWIPKDRENVFLLFLE